MIIPLRQYAKVQTVLIIISLISPFVMLGALLPGHDAFVSMWNAVSSTSYQGVIAAAQKAGYTSAAYQPNLTETVEAAPILGFYLLTIWPVQIAGELKNLKKSIFTGLLGAVMFSWIVFTVGVLLYYGTVGFDFSNSLIVPGNAGFRRLHGGLVGTWDRSLLRGQRLQEASRHRHNRRLQNDPARITLQLQCERLVMVQRGGLLLHNHLVALRIPRSLLSLSAKARLIVIWA